MNPDDSLARILEEDAEVLATLSDLTDDGVRAAIVAGENARRRREHPVRLDPELWRPPLQWHPPVDHAAQDARREWRRRNRPFRRAFVGGEARRNALLKAGLAMAAERNRKAAGL